MKHYETIIVLAPGVTQDENGNLEFSSEAISFRYKIIGDPHEFRFKAVQKLYQHKACSNFILVGGTVDIEKDGKLAEFTSNGKSIPKAEVMKTRLAIQYNVDANILIPLKSPSSTEGNAIEVLRYLVEVNRQLTDGIGLLTNFYHLPRAIRMFGDMANLRLIPICAESIVYDEQFENIKQFYKSEGFSRILNDLRECKSEIRGMKAQEEGSYISRAK